MSTSRRTLFRPCIDLHDGQVKQIVGGTLSDAPEQLKTNFVANKPPRHYAELYRENNLEGGHIIMLGKGNADAAKEALAAWPGVYRILRFRRVLRNNVCRRVAGWRGHHRRELQGMARSRSQQGRFHMCFVCSSS